MKIATVGLWHLGTVTSLCLSDLGHDIYAFDQDEEVINNFNSNIPVVYEPKIKNLLSKHLKKKIFFSSNLDDLKKYKVIFVNYDTKIQENDSSNFQLLFDKIKKILKIASKNTLIIVTSQIPVGSIKKFENFEKKFVKKKIEFVYIPENLRLGKSVEIFKNPDRMVFGIRNLKSKNISSKIFKKIKCNKIFVSPETAEMNKHVINSFLACSISFINEIGNISKNFKIPFDDLEKCVKSDKRIGYQSYLKPGNAFSGGTLGRDLNYLIEISNKLNLSNNLIKSIYKSNQIHSRWVTHYIEKNFKSNKCKILQIGLSYTENTSTLRRSLPFQIFKYLNKKYNIKFCDNDYIMKSKETSKFKKQAIDYSKKNKFNLILIFSDNFNFNLIKQNLGKNTFVLDANNSIKTKNFFKKYRYISTENA